MTDSTQQTDAGGGRKGRSLADLIDVSPRPSLRESLPPHSLLKIAVIGALLVWMNWWQLEELFSRWRHDNNWSHGFIIPLFSLYLLYARRDELFAARRRVCVWGLPLVILSVAWILVGYHPIHTHWLCQLGIVALLFSLVLYLGGPSVIRITWLPILFLALAMPIPPMLYQRISVPLQEFAARCSVLVLRVFGVTISVTASNLAITSASGFQHSLTVAEACSGVRSLMAFVALGVAWAYLENRPIWQRVALVASAVPIAILCNVLRVTITCSMYVVDEPELGQNFMHKFTGMLMLVPALLMFWGLSELLRRLFVEAEEPQPAPAAQDGAD